MSEHHHGAHADPHDPFQKRVALAMSIYAVLLAFVTMMTNQARTEALLLSNEAANEWSYFQAKSTKGMLVKAEADLLDALGSDGKTVEPEKVTRAREHFLAESVRYDQEKDQIKEKADELVAEGEVNKKKEGQFEYASVALELGIVMATVALLLSSRPAFLVSVLLAASGLGWTARTATIKAEPPKHVASTPHAGTKGDTPEAKAEAKPEAGADATSEAKADPTGAPPAK